MRTREPFTLYRRKTKNKAIYYYVTYDETGMRRKFSTGCTSKAQAYAYAMELHRTGCLIPEDRPIVEQAKITFEEYSKGWWTRDSDYVKEAALRGRILSDQYLGISASQLKLHILPTFKRFLLEDITTAKIETWQRQLVEKTGLAPKSVNNIVSILSVMLEEARRQDLITSNPVKEVRPLARNSKQRGVLTYEEAKDLLTNLSYWDNPVAYTASLLAACTGMRLSEIRALRGIDLRQGYIHVTHSADLKGDLKSTKTGDSRDLPIPESLMEALSSLAKLAGPSERLFSIAGVPMEHNAIRQGFYRALAKKGIKEKERKERNITFHSWRHFLNSQLLAHGIPETKTRRITGHSTSAMTDHYAHFLVDDFADVLQITSQITIRDSNKKGP